MQPFSGERTGLAIVLDVTGSMHKYVRSIQEGLARYIINSVMEGRDLERLTLVTFDDHYSGMTRPWARHNVERVYDKTKRDASKAQWFKNIKEAFTTDNLEEYIEALYNVELWWGGDAAECMACSLAKARELDPDADIWLVTDAYDPQVQYDQRPKDERSSGYDLPCCDKGIAFSLTNVMGIVGARDIWRNKGVPVVSLNDLFPSDDGEEDEGYPEGVAEPAPLVLGSMDRASSRHEVGRA